MKVTDPSARTDEPPPTTAARAASLWARFTRRYPRGAAMLVLTVLVLLVTLMHIRVYTYFSPYDENHHADYLIRAARGQIVLQADDPMTQEALREYACHGSQVTVLPECGLDHYRAADLTPRGTNAAAAHSPYYYAITGLPARALAALPLTPNSLVTWARVLGSAWLLLGCYLTLRVAGLLRVKQLPVVLALIFLAVSPVLLHASTTVNPDASAFACGAIALLGALAWERGRPLWVLGAAAFACAAFDPTNALGLMLVLLYFGARAFIRSSPRSTSPDVPARDLKSYLVAAAVVIGAGALAYLSWKGLYNHLVPNQRELELSPNHQLFVVDHLEAKWFVGQEALFNNFPPIFGLLADPLEKEPYGVMVAAGGFLIIGALLAVVVNPTPEAGRFRAVAIATLASVLLATPALVLYNYVSSDIYFEIPTRMLLSLVCGLAVVVGGACSGRVGRGALGLCAGGLYLVTAYLLADAIRT
jgi:hypothetical protein